MKPVLALMFLAAGPALSEEHTAADCAALWQGVALEAADNPSLPGSPETASLLAREFSLTAADDGLTGAPLRAAILEALPDYRLLYRGVIAGDLQSRELFESHAKACSGLLEKS